MSSDVYKIEIECIAEPPKGVEPVVSNSTPGSLDADAEPVFVFIKEEPKEEEDSNGRPESPLVSDPDGQPILEHSSLEHPSLEPPSLVVKTEIPEGDPEPPKSHFFNVTVKQESADADDAKTNGNLEDSNAKSDFFTPVSDLQLPESKYYISNEVLSKLQPKDGKFECQICLKTFSNKSNLTRHLVIHKKYTIECGSCPRRFLNKEQLDKHMIREHAPPRTYPCKQCPKIFRSISNLHQHERVHITERPHVCQICERTFAVQSQLLRHLEKRYCRRPVGPLICEICNKIFKQQFLYKSHLKMHTTEKPFECEHCKVSFKHKSTLIRHIQLHTNTRPYSCDFCNKTFTTSGLLKPHLRMHTGEKPFECPICEKCFSHKHNMQRHAQRHNKIRHLVCEVCQKVFPKESRLKYHMRTHMVDKRPFKCDFCPKSFSHKQNIIRHYGRKHPNETYDKPETDASIARDIWQAVMKKKLEMANEYILPETEWPEEAPVIKTEEE